MNETMREITTHKVSGATSEVNDAISIHADGPGPGNASHKYSIRWKNERDQTEPHCFIGFQNGPVKENGVNGVTDEALMAILIDRLEGFQAGKYASDENAETLHRMKMALASAQLRTKRRQARGVEGTMAV